MNVEMKKVMMNGPINDFKTSCVNFFTLYLGKYLFAVQDTNLTFSEEEVNALSNKRFFEVKQTATQKVLVLLGELEKRLKSEVSVISLFANHGVELKETGKIFRGENYRMMPYVILDYPRLFTTDSVFAFRSMFWWGNEFSFTLHLQGHALETFRKNLLNNIHSLKGHNFFICINDTPWEYVFDETNYAQLDNFLQEDRDELTQLLTNHKFIKLSCKLELSNYAGLVSTGTETFKTLMKILQ
jgi:hypothetical protein